MARYHPSDDWLSVYASGALDEPTSVLIATHLTFCPECRREAQLHEAIGGALFEQLVEESDRGEFDSIAPKDAAATDAADEDDAPALDGSLSEIAPRPLLQYVAGLTGSCDLEALPWRYYGNGIERAILVESSDGALARLLRAQPGAKFPHHGHLSDELTVVLQGAYKDETGRYDVGDVQCAPMEMSHQPVIEPGDICIALVVSERPTVPTNFVARIAQKILGP